VLLIDAADPLAPHLATVADVGRLMPGVLDGLVEWLKCCTTTEPRAHSFARRAPPPHGFHGRYYKTTDGKAVNVLPSDEPRPPLAAAAVISLCHAAWAQMQNRSAHRAHSPVAAM
jgi:hypothetical protein